MIRFQKRRLVAKTANYSVNPGKGDFSGSIFTNRGATGAVTFTLPNPNAGLAETLYDSLSVVDQTLTVAAPTGKVLTFNNAAATSVAASTAGQKIGAAVSAYCDGVSWVVTGRTVGVTYTVA